MVRIPDAELSRLKAEVSVQRLVEGCGVALRRQGRDFVGCCPFHDDREGVELAVRVELLLREPESRVEQAVEVVLSLLRSSVAPRSHVVSWLGR